MNLNRNQLISLTVFCLTLLGVAFWVLYAEYSRPWKEYQKEFNQIEYDLAAGQYQKLLLERQDVSEKQQRADGIDKELVFLKNKLSAIPGRTGKIKQLWLQDIGETDRCITCHQGADKPGFENTPQPFKTHSGNYLKQHPVERYGCVICHEGQGAALTVKDAHGEVRNWAKPVLRGRLAQSSCGKCHFMEQNLPLSSELSGAPVYSGGWRLFQKYNCIGCHKLEENKRPDYIGPSLTSIGIKVNKGWLVSWLKNPEGYLPETSMPRFNITDEEIEYVAEYLLSLKTVTRRGTARRAPADNNGEKLVESLGCPGCHTINKKGSAFAPDLSDIGNKVNQDWLYQWLKKPGVLNSKTRMPDLMLSETEAESAAAYLAGLKKDKDKKLSDTSKQGKFLSEYAEKGRKLVKDLGCTGCHEIGNLLFQYNAPELSGIGDKRIDELFFGNMTAGKRDLISWLRTKVTYPGRFNTDKMAARMPVYKLEEKQTEALTVFLLSLRKESLPPQYTRSLFNADGADVRGKKLFEMYNCSGCHRINKEGGNIAPELTDAGKKSRPEWLFSFLKKPGKIRPLQILRARMPDFGLSGEDVNDLIEYLYFISKEPYPFNSQPKQEISPEDVFDGEKLYQEVFACSSCHIVGEHGGEIGPDHTDLASRLKREWIEEWLKDPQAIQPDVRMPKFKFEDWEFNALTNYLMTMGKYRFVQVKKEE